MPRPIFAPSSTGWPKYGVLASVVTESMGWVDDGVGDLLYDIELGFQHEIEEQDPV